LEQRRVKISQFLTNCKHGVDIGVGGVVAVDGNVMLLLFVLWLFMMMMLLLLLVLVLLKPRLNAKPLTNDNKRSMVFN